MATGLGTDLENLMATATDPGVRTILSLKGAKLNEFREKKSLSVGDNVLAEVRGVGGSDEVLFYLFIPL